MLILAADVQYMEHRGEMNPTELLQLIDSTIEDDDMPKEMKLFRIDTSYYELGTAWTEYQQRGINWRTLDVDLLSKYHNYLSYYTPEAFAYLFPGYIKRCLEHPQVLCDLTLEVLSLMEPNDEIMDLFIELTRELSCVEIRIFVEYLQHLLKDAPNDILELDMDIEIAENCLAYWQAKCLHGTEK